MDERSPQSHPPTGLTARKQIMVASHMPLYGCGRSQYDNIAVEVVVRLFLAGSINLTSEMIMIAGFLSLKRITSLPLSAQFLQFLKKGWCL
jgi:uncharacterized membrane protein